MSYPKWIYSASGSMVINSEDEYPKEGWYESPADVPSEAPAEVAEVAEVAEEAPKRRGRPPKAQ